MPRIVALVIDILFVICFATIGRASHSEALTIGGVFGTAWPFLVGLAIGWAAIAALKLPTTGVKAGGVLWVATLALGMLFRVLAGGSTAFAFIAVAGITLALFLIGWRAGYARLRRSLRRSTTEL